MEVTVSCQYPIGTNPLAWKQEFQSEYEKAEVRYLTQHTHMLLCCDLGTLLIHVLRHLAKEACAKCQSASPKIPGHLQY